MRKALFLVLVLAVFLAASVSAEYTLCNNSSKAALTSKTGINGFRQINQTVWGFDDTGSDFFYLTNESFGLYFNFSYTLMGFRDTRGFAYNRSRQSIDYLWFVDRRSNSIFQVNATGNLTTNHSTKGFTVEDAVGIDTLDGSKFYILDNTKDTIYTTDSNMTQISACNISTTVSGTSHDITLRISNNVVRGFVVSETDEDKLIFMDTLCNVEKLIYYSHLGNPTSTSITTFDNSTFQSMNQQTNGIIYNITNDTTTPKLTGLRLNDTRYISGNTLNLSFDVQDECGPHRAIVATNESGVLTNKSTNPSVLSLRSNDTNTITYVMQWSNASMCSRDISFQVVVNDTAGNRNQTTINFTTVLPYMLNFQNNGTEPWNCTAISSSNLTYTFGATTWWNFSINMSTVIGGSNVTCPYIASGAELTNITVNLTSACKVHALNRVKPSNTVTFQLYTALTAAGVSNLPAAVAVAAITSIIVATAYARLRRN